jgi:hypothetical protein
MKLIKAQFILDPQKNQQAAGYANGKTGNVYAGIDFVFSDVSQGDF